MLSWLNFYLICDYFIFQDGPYPNNNQLHICGFKYRILFISKIKIRQCIMFVGRRRVCQLEMCDRNVFGNMVIVRQNPPVSPLPSTFTDPIPMPSPLTQSRRRTTSDELQFSSREKEQNERRRTSQLLDELLLDIYNRDNCSSLSGYTSTTSLRSQKSFNKYFVCDLQLHGE